jgi:hypothetical protein
MEIEERAAFPVAGGIMQYGYQCGMIWGAALAAGAQAYQLFGPGPQAEAGAIMAAQTLVESFRTRNDTTDCLDITGLDKSSSNLQMTTYFFIKGGVIRCMRMTVEYAQEAFDTIDTALAEENIEAAAPPVSCAAMLAQKMSVSNVHQAMVAGLAGGIGLCGGGCGALGAAIWFFEMDRIKEGTGRTDFENPRALAAIDKFTKCTGNEFECSKIVGRKFENVDDHAAYLRGGGCSEIVEALAA